MGNRVVVIGAGIAGLAAASYLQRNGFETSVHELHDSPGGLCAAWKRGGYTFDGCIHWLMGSGPASNLHELWRELGAGDLTYIEWDEYAVVALSDGDVFTVYTDPVKLAAEMRRLGPDDGKVIDLICGKIAAVSRIDLPAAADKMGIGEWAALAVNFPAALPVLMKYTKVSVADLAARMRGPKLKEAFEAMFGAAMRDFPAAGLFMMLGFMAKRSAGYPLGGSAAFAAAIEAKYLALGGIVHYRSRVDEILVANGRAAGVRIGGTTLPADFVVSAADAYDTIERLLGGRFRHPDLDAAFVEMPRFPSLLYLSLGLAGDSAGQPHSRIVKLAAPLVLEDGALTVDRLSLRLFNFDPGLAPAGKTAAAVMIETANDAYWTKLKEGGGDAYRAAKAKTTAAVVAALDKAVPGIAGRVETTDLATPATFIRYTNNWHGSYEGWLPAIGVLGRKIAKTVDGVAGLHLVGQWVNPGGGLPPCALDGRALARRLCRETGRRFRPD